MTSRLIAVAFANQCRSMESPFGQSQNRVNPSSEPWAVPYVFCRNSKVLL